MSNGCRKKKTPAVAFYTCGRFSFCWPLLGRGATAGRPRPGSKIGRTLNTNCTTAGRLREEWPFVPKISMTPSESVIDLTADSPPFSARAGPSRSPSRSRRPNTASGGLPSRRGRSSTQATPNDYDEDVSVVGFSLGAPRRAVRHRQNSPNPTLSDPSIIEVRHAPPAQRIHDGIPPGPYTRSTRASARSAASSAARTELLERIGLLASRYVARSRSATAATPQTLLRPYANYESHANPPRASKGLSSAALQRGFDPQWTHPLPPLPGFSQSIVEPPIDLEGVLAGDKDAIAPLPDTTPICAGCKCALLLDGTGDTRIWALPCGHVIDGRCVARLGGTEEDAARVFPCPVPHCKQRCHPEPGHRHSCIPVYI